MQKNNVIYWLPRILSLCFVVFVSLFALDAFSGPDLAENIAGFLIHLIPSVIILLLVIIAWKYDLVGAIVFFGLAILYVFMVGFDRHWSWYLGISGPAVLVGALYLASWIQGRKKRIR